MNPFRRILATTDFGESSARGLEIAADLAVRYGAELIIVHAVAPPTSLLSGTILADPEPARASAQQGLSAGVERAQQTVPAARGELLDGAPAATILAYIEENAVDLVVVGTHGRGRVVRALLGSVADKIVRTSRVPVLTVYDTEDLAIARLGVPSA